MTVRVDAPEPRLEHLYDMHVDLNPPQDVGAAPAGNRQIYIVKGGRLEGPRLKGGVLPGGGDWALVRTDGAVQLDVRATLKLDDGAHVYAQYSGLIIGTPEVFGRIMGGEDVPLSEYYFYTNPMFQTGDERYAWLNQVMAIGRGKVIPGGVEYRVWAVRNPA
ncbi:MAG: DUF3237 domain-containing protein [Dehalococcoidia bacterium]